MSNEYHVTHSFKYTLDPTGMRQYGFTRPGGGFHIIGERRAAHRPHVEAFIDALFRHADPDSHLALRSFPLREGNKAFFKLWPRVGDPDLIDQICENIAKAANYKEPLSFTPPVCTFTTNKNAAKANPADGLAISVECDEAPNAARATLTALLGPPTCIVFSGGTWTNSETGEIEDKVHLHWRLKATTRTEDEHAKLREARRLATDLVGADATNKSIVHPIRWPGSWHLKSTPRLARLEADPNVEIDLDAALEQLRNACPSERGKKTSPSGVSKIASPEEIMAAVSVIPNDNLSWDDWNKLGMMIWAASMGQDYGAFDFISRKSGKYNEEITAARWRHYFDSPPTDIGAGSLFWNANQHDPDWRDRITTSATDAKPAISKAPPSDPKPAAKDARITPSDAAFVTSVTKQLAQLAGVRLKDFYAYMPMHNYIFAPSREPWPGSSVNARVPAVKLTNKKGKPVIDKKTGEQKIIPASAWLDKNSPVEQMTWAPGRPMLIKDRLIADGGWIERKGVACFNLYRPPTIKHGNAAKAGPWLDHVRMVYPDDADHIIFWNAQRVQRPEVKINHALLLGGAQGIGKDTLLEPVKHAVGDWNFHEIGPQQVLWPFNGFLKSTILRINEARDLGDVNRFQFYDHMKAYTAAPPDVLRVNEKHLREHYVLNCLGPIITTNHKDSLYLPADDRRHFVVWSERKKGDYSADYWNKLWNWYHNGGFGHVAAYLATLDLSSFDPKAPPPKTAAFWEVVDSSRSTEDAELQDAIDKLGKPGALTLGEIAEQATTDDFERWLTDRKNRRNVPHRLEACGYVPIRNDDADDGLWRIEGKRQVIYAQQTLSIRDRIMAARALVGRKAEEAKKL